MTTRQRIWTWGGIIALIAAVTLIATAAWSQTTVEIPIETIFKGDPGDLFAIGEAPAPAGTQCVAELEGHNNESIHPDSDILVGPATFTDVENGTFQAAGLAFTSDGVNQVYVRLGADGVFSAGFLLEVTCNPPNTTTTTNTATPTTTLPQPSTTVAEPPPTTVTPPATTTTSPPPVGGIDTGYGACADGACDGSLSPLVTWLLIGVALPMVGGLIWAYFRYTFGDIG